MKKFKTSDILNNKEYLALLSKSYTNKKQVKARIIDLKSRLKLPKGTEHFITDIHGENDAFEHVLRNCAGSIKRKVSETISDSDANLKTLNTLIYYPSEKLKLLEEDNALTTEWYKKTIKQLILVLKNVASKSTIKETKDALDKDYANLIEELIFENDMSVKRELYYECIIDSIIETGASKEIIKTLCSSIKILNLDHLHIIGDIYDRGRYANKCMDIISNYHSVDIQWGNHDIVWMGAKFGSLACIANVVRICLRYGNIETLREAYGIGLLSLSIFANKTYLNDTKEDLKAFMPHLGDERPDIDALMLARMQKAIAIIQFKIEGDTIKNHPEYHMEDRDLLSKCDFDKNIVKIEGKEYKLNTYSFPTINKNDIFKLTPEEEKIINLLKKNFTTSEKLEFHVNTLLTKGNMYIIYNDNLLFHGCIPMEEDGSFKDVMVNGKISCGKNLLKNMEDYLRSIITEDDNDMSYFWYLWCSPDSPLFGKSKMATFERYFINNKTTHKEEYLPYYILSKQEKYANKILSEFNLTSKYSKIINGHVPIKLKEGQDPISANGKLLLIDGGYSKAYRKVTGIAGFTLTYNSYGLNLITHHPFTNQYDAIENELDIQSEHRFLSNNHKRILVENTHKAKEINKKIYYLEMLLFAYEKGIL